MCRICMRLQQRQVHQKKVTQITTEALGCELAYTREAYKRDHQDREPEADGLTASSI